MIAEQDQMWCYLWEDLTDRENGLTECKFGERFVRADQDPQEQCHKRIRESLGVRKDAWDTGRIRVVQLWNVSELAETVNRNRRGGKMDDWLRAQIGYRKGTTGEVHTISGDDMRVRVNRLIAKLGGELIHAGLSTPQHQVAVEVLERFQQGDRCVLAELCARFGKTIWSGAVAHQTEAQLVVVASYVKTVFTSFAGDLTSFEQFRDFVHVDTQAPDYQEQISQALESGKRVIAYLSMAQSTKRNQRINHLLTMPVTKMLIVDEADFGVHKPGQAKPLIEHVNTTDHILIMTGTNADRAATLWPIDHITSVTYPELLIQKSLSETGACEYQSDQLADFPVNADRDALAPGIECYQMDLSGPVQSAIDAGEITDEEFKLLPSWAKFAAHPVKSKGFFTRTLQSIFLGQGNHDELNVDLQVGTAESRVAMLFMPANTRNDVMEQIGVIAGQTLPGFEVITLCGSMTHNGKKITNRNAEGITREVVETAQKNGRSVLIIASQQAQRSFSIPEITELYLAYDRGESGSTIQKMSRTLTPGIKGKVGRIFSLSFDPNRDDKFDGMIVETSLNYKRRYGKKSLQEAMRDVLRTIDIFTCTPDGAVAMNKDTFLEAALARKGISRVLGKIVNLNLLTGDDISALASGNSAYFQNDQQERTQSGKTRDPQDKKGSKTSSKKDSTARELAKAREVVVTILENLDVIILGTGKKNIVDAMQTIKYNDDFTQCVEQEFGVPVETIEYLFHKNIIRQDWVELLHDQICEEMA